MSLYRQRTVLDKMVKSHSDGATISVRVMPNASRNAATFDEQRERLAVRLAAPPVEGKANAELLRFLAKLVGVPRSSLEIIRGASSREKVVLVRCANAGEVRERLEGALGEKR